MAGPAARRGSRIWPKFVALARCGVGALWGWPPVGLASCGVGLKPFQHSNPSTEPRGWPRSTAPHLCLLLQLVLDNAHGVLRFQVHRIFLPLARGGASAA
jgi:hypothetical protein